MIPVFPVCSASDWKMDNDHFPSAKYFVAKTVAIKG